MKEIEDTKDPRFDMMEEELEKFRFENKAGPGYSLDSNTMKSNLKEKIKKQIDKFKFSIKLPLIFFEYHSHLKKIKLNYFKDGIYKIDVYTYSSNRMYTYSALGCSEKEMSLIVRLDSNKGYLTEYKTGFKIPVAYEYESLEDTKIKSSKYSYQRGMNVLPFYAIIYVADKYNTYTCKIKTDAKFYEGHVCLDDLPVDDTFKILEEYEALHSDASEFEKELKELVEKGNRRIKKINYSDKDVASSLDNISKIKHKGW